MDPTLAGFQTFITNVMGISSGNLSPTNPVIAFVYNLAVNMVNPAIDHLPNSDPTQPTMYAVAVYNYAGDALIQLAQDTAPSFTPPVSYFVGLRQSYGLNSLPTGMVSSTGDQGTNSSYVVPDFAATLQIMDLQQMKTPYGRMYLSIAQNYGSLWGLS
jgi:hypothetical protein